MTKKEFTLQAIISMAGHSDLVKTDYDTLKHLTYKANIIKLNAMRLAELVEDEGLFDDAEE